MPVHNQQTEGMGFDFWWHSSSATGNRGKRRFTITKAIKLLETTTPYTCRILLQTTLSSFHWIGWGDGGSRPMHAFGSLLPLASRDGESMRCPASYWWKRLPWSRGPPSTGNGLVDAVDAFEASISSEGWEQGSLLHSSDSIPGDKLSWEFTFFIASVRLRISKGEAVFAPESEYAAWIFARLGSWPSACTFDYAFLPSITGFPAWLRRLYAFPACFLGDSNPETFYLDSFGIGMPSMITALMKTVSSAS